MKKIILFFLLTSFLSLHAQSTEDLIQKIQEEYAYLNQEILPVSAKVKVVRAMNHNMLFLIEDDIMGIDFDCIDLNTYGVYELYLHRRTGEKKWNLVQVVLQSTFAEGITTWHTANYYFFWDQELIFSHQIREEVYTRDSPTEKSYFDRKEERYYYHQGQLIRHLYKEAKTEQDGYHDDMLSGPSIDEIMNQAPSKERTITQNNNYNNIRPLIEKLVEDWGYGAELPDW